MEPIAKRLRQSAESALLPAGGKKRRAQAAEAEDVAARIRRLEAELQGSGGGESSSSDSEGSEDEEDEGEGEADGGGVVSLSAFASERVAALPEQLLPPRASSAAALSHSKQTTKKKRTGDKSEPPELLDVIQWPKKVPFACKPCAFVGKDMAEFSAHRESAEHLARAAQGPQTLLCKLCDKAFTSPSQLSEHKAGKWHQQRLHRKKERHVVRVCYDFMRGSCRRGDQCAFEHTETKAMRRGTALDKSRRRPCDAFARSGSCKFGDKCLFGHSAA